MYAYVKSLTHVRWSNGRVKYPVAAADGLHSKYVTYPPIIFYFTFSTTFYSPSCNPTLYIFISVGILYLVCFVFPTLRKKLLDKGQLIEPLGSMF